MAARSLTHRLSTDSPLRRRSLHLISLRDSIPGIDQDQKIFILHVRSDVCLQIILLTGHLCSLLRLLIRLRVFVLRVGIRSLPVVFA